MGLREDKDRFYIITEARKVDVRVELQQEVFMHGKFSEKTAAKVMGTIMKAMQHAHKNNMYHGYLRPGNILVERGSNFDDMRIINFPLGIAFQGNTQLNETFQFP